MFWTATLGALGCLGGPIGALGLGAIGVAMDADMAKQSSSSSSNLEAPEGIKVDGSLKDRHTPQWNARYQRWETPYQAAERAAKGETPPTRATASQWVDPVDPAFQD